MAIVIENPALERRLRRLAADKGVTPEVLIATTLDRVADSESEDVIEALKNRLGKYKGEAAFSKVDYDAVFEPLG